MLVSKAMALIAQTSLLKHFSQLLLDDFPSNGGRTISTSLSPSSELS